MELPFLPSFKTANSTPEAVPSKTNLFAEAFAGPISRGTAVVNSIKQGSLTPLKESIAAQNTAGSEKVNMLTGQPINMSYADPRKAPPTTSKAAYSIIGSLAGPQGSGAGLRAVAATPVGGVVSKLIAAIKDAKPIRSQANKMASVERGQRAGAGAGALKAGSGEGAFFSALGQLKGELPKPQFEGVRAQKNAPTSFEAKAGTPEQLKAEIEIRQDALDNSMAQGLRKYYGGQDPNYANLDDIFSRNVGNKKSGSLDEVVQEHGFNDVQQAHEAVLQDLQEQQTINGLREQLKNTANQQTAALSNSQKLTQPEVDILFNAVKEYPLDFYSQINAMSGLSKILGDGGGQIPTPGELKLLGQIFGKDLPAEVFNKRDRATKIWDMTKDIINVPRSLMSSMDMSAPLRQGAVLFANNPKQGAAAFKQMFKFFGNEKYFDAAMADIQSRPSFGLMRQSGLAVTDSTPLNFDINAKEEAFMSNLAGKIPGVGRLVQASERAYTGFLNKLRADVFDDISRQYIEGGVTPHDSPEVFERLADFINTASGRGSLGPLNKAAPIMNGVFFSPRFMASRFQMLNPQWYFSQTPQVRKLAVLSAVKFVGTGLGIVSLAKMGGAKVETDPRSADFGQIRIGNFRWDVWAGFRPWVNLIAREVAGESKSTSTGRMYPANRLETPFRFLRSKLAPVPGLAADLLHGKDMLGMPVDVDQELVEKVTPLYVQDIIKAIHQGGLVGGVSLGVPAFFGVGVNAYSPRQNKNSGGLPSMPELPALPKLPRLPKL